MKTRMKIWLDEPEEDNLGQLWCVDSLNNSAYENGDSSLGDNCGRLLGVKKDWKRVYEYNGFVVMRSPRTMKPIGKGRYISQDRDYFNLFDLCAKKKGWTVWIQVKSTPSGVSSAKKSILEFAQNYGADTDIFNIWLKVARKGIVVYTYFEAEKVWKKVFMNFKGEVVKPFKITKVKQ